MRTPPFFFVSGVAFLLFDMLSECACDHGYLIQHCLRFAIFACLVALCLVREMWCLCFVLGGFVGSPPPPLLFLPQRMMSIVLLLLGPSGSSTTKVIYVQGVFSGQAYAYGLYCCRFHSCNQSSVIRFTIAWGASYMVLIL